MSIPVPMEGFGGGGGAGLNFDVKAYATEEVRLAATPKENTIGIITEHKITGWMFDTAEPAEPVEGMVYITTGISSNVTFNALRKNGIQIYMLAVKLYVNGAMMDANAMIYQERKWKALSSYIFQSGEGRKVALTVSGQNYAEITETKTSIKVTLKYGVDTSGQSIIMTEEPMDVSNAKTMRVKYHCAAAATAAKYKPKFGVGSVAWQFDSYDNMSCYSLMEVNDQATEYLLDISAMSGQCYIGFGGAFEGEIYDFSLEY